MKVKILNEYGTEQKELNKYAKAIHEVEDLMRNYNIRLDWIGIGFRITILDREFRLNDPSFPRMFEEQKLEII